MQLLLAQGARLIVLGAIAGLGASVLLSRLLTSFLFGVDPHDPLVFATATLVFAGVGVLACYIPARRAIRVPPATVLQEE